MPDQPDKKENLRITITKDPENPNVCEIKDHFVARGGSKVTFVFNEPGALITFADDDSPFEKPKFKPGTQVVRENARIGAYEYSVNWPSDGAGNGTGEVIGR